MIKAKVTSFAFSATLLCATAINAPAFFDGPTAKGDGKTAYTAKRILACTVVKTSYKGENEGFFSDAEKSVEATCHDRDGQAIDFSATMPQWATLTEYVGRQALVYLSDEKLNNAKTPWTLIEIRPTDQKTYKMEKLCGTNEGEHLLQGQKVWSRGFRLAQAYQSERTTQGWQLQAYVGEKGDAKWAEQGSLLLGEPCKTQIHVIMGQQVPLIYTYVQEHEKPNYLIESIYRLVPGQ